MGGEQFKEKAGEYLRLAGFFGSTASKIEEESINPVLAEKMREVQEKLEKFARFIGSENIPSEEYLAVIEAHEVENIKSSLKEILKEIEERYRSITTNVKLKEIIDLMREDPSQVSPSQKAQLDKLVVEHRIFEEFVRNIYSYELLSRIAEDVEISDVIDSILDLIQKTKEMLSPSLAQIYLTSLDETHYVVRRDDERKIITIIPQKTSDELIPINFDAIEEKLLGGKTPESSVSSVYELRVAIPKNLDAKYRVLDVDEVSTEHILKPVKVRGIVQAVNPVEHRLWRIRVSTKEGNIDRILILPTEVYTETGKKVRPIPSPLNLRIESQMGIFQIIPEKIEKSRVPTKTLQFVIEGSMANKITAGERYEFIAIPFYRDPLLRSEMPILYVVDAKPLSKLLSFKIEEKDIEKFKAIKEYVSTDLKSEVEKFREETGLNISPMHYAILQSFVPDIRNNTLNAMMKLAMLISAVKGYLKDGRSEVHVLIIGEPSTGKSHIAKKLEELHPKALYVSGKSASGVGLTVSVVYDKSLKRWIAKAGMMVLADGGLIMIDEFDKTRDEDITNLYEAMEHGRITVAKADIYEIFPAKTSVIGIANPKGHVIGDIKDISAILKKINLEPALVSRFDIVAVITDETTYDDDIADALNIIRRAKGKKFKTIMDKDTLRKYLAYVMNLKPEIPDEVDMYIAKRYAELREESRKRGELTYILRKRNLEGILRIATALAKLNMSEVVTKDDVDLAIQMMTYSQKIRAEAEKNDKVTKRVLKKQLEEFVASKGVKAITVDDLDGIADEIIKRYNYVEELKPEIKAKVEEILSKDWVRDNIVEPKKTKNGIMWVMKSSTLAEFIGEDEEAFEEEEEEEIDNSREDEWNAMSDDEKIEDLKRATKEYFEEKEEMREDFKEELIHYILRKLRIGKNKRGDVARLIDTVLDILEREGFLKVELTDEGFVNYSRRRA